MKDDQKPYSLINACFESLEEAGKLLAAELGLIHERDGVGETALHYLVIENQLGAVRFLLKRGADINIQDDFKSTPLAHAVQCGYKEMVEYLLSQGADVNLINETEDAPIHHAIFNNGSKIILKLIQAGADINGVDDLKETPFHRAVESDDCLDGTRVLIENGSNIDVKELK